MRHIVKGMESATHVQKRCMANFPVLDAVAGKELCSGPLEVRLRFLSTVNDLSMTSYSLSPQNFDILTVGSGLTGLTAALHLDPR